MNYNFNYSNYGRYLNVLKQKISPSSEQDSFLNGKESQNAKENIPLGADYFAESKIENVFHSIPQ